MFQIIGERHFSLFVAKRRECMLKIGLRQWVCEPIHALAKCRKIRRVTDPRQNPRCDASHFAVVMMHKSPHQLECGGASPARQRRSGHQSFFRLPRVSHRVPQQSPVPDLPNFEQALAGMDMTMWILAAQDVQQRLRLSKSTSTNQFTRQSAAALIIGFGRQTGLELFANLLAKSTHRKRLGGVHRRPEFFGFQAFPQNV
jgi:hypothetical protein